MSVNLSPYQKIASVSWYFILFQILIKICFEKSFIILQGPGREEEE